MKLITVKSATGTANAGFTDFDLTVTDADDGTGDQYDLPFTLSADDTADMATQIGAWLAANPSFTVGPYAAPAPTADEVWAEKDRRWALGFDYDFGDARGVQHIGTSAKDLDDWNKVTTAAQVALNAGQPTTEMTIYPAATAITVTAAEWQQVLAAAAAFFQPVMVAAAALVAMDPIPADYADDSHWPAA